MKNVLFIIIFLLMAGEAYAAGNASGTATTAPSVVENILPEAIFDQIRGFLTVPVPNLNISINTPKMPDFNVSGIQNWNGQIRDISGIDILKFFRFVLNVFLVAIRYLLNVLPGTAG